MAKKIRFLVKKMDSSKRSETPEKSVNKIQKDIAVEFLNLIGLGRPKEGLRFFTPDCKTHNPYVIGGMDALVDAMIAVQKKGAEGIRKGSRLTLSLSSGMCLLMETSLQCIRNSQAPIPTTEG